ncbi:hypothetical protein KIN20_002533, partial [Parelaphostrongylus tenuis]
LRMVSTLWMFEPPTTMIQPVTMLALDYSIILNKEIDGLPVFRIDPSSGKIFAMVI